MVQDGEQGDEVFAWAGFRGPAPRLEIATNLRRVDANDISAILARIGGWERSKAKIRIPLYGPQWIYVPKSCSKD